MVRTSLNGVLIHLHIRWPSSSVWMSPLPPDLIHAVHVMTANAGLNAVITLTNACRQKITLFMSMKLMKPGLCGMKQRRILLNILEISTHYSSYSDQALKSKPARNMSLHFKDHCIVTVQWQLSRLSIWVELHWLLLFLMVTTLKVNHELAITDVSFFLRTSSAPASRTCN